MNVKRTHWNTKGRRGFSLVELLVVIAIIAILAGMVAFAAAGIQKKVLRDRTRAFLGELSQGLANYQVDNGHYPVNRVDSPAEDGAHILYQHLSGDFDLNGEPDEDEEMYVDSIDFRSSQRLGTQTVAVNGQSQYVLVDAFNNLIRYHADPPNYMEGGERVIRTRNPTYDLWSLGGGEPESNNPADMARWITNWD